MMRWGKICASLTATSMTLSLYSSMVSWTGNTNNEWMIGSNWSSGMVPSPTDDLTFPNTGLNKTMLNDLPMGSVYLSFVFDDNGYQINGNPFQLQNGSGNVQLVLTNNVTTAIPISPSFTLMSDLDINVMNNAGTIEFNGEIQETGSPKNLNKTGPGRAYLAASNYTGTLTISGGVVQLSDNAVPVGAVVNNADIEFDISGSTNFSNSISGSGNLKKQNSGNFSISVDQSYAGSTSILDGTVSLVNTDLGALFSSSEIIVSSGAFFDISQAIGNTYIKDLSGPSGSTVFLGDRTLYCGTTNSTSFDGNISGSGGLFKQGSGTFSLGGLNQLSGSINVYEGVLALSGSGSVTSSNYIVLSPGTQLDISAASGDSVINGLAGSGLVNLGARNLIVGANFPVFIGVIQGSGGITKQGSGSLTFTQVQTYTGSTNIAAGTLALSGVGNINSSGSLFIDSGGVFDIASATGSRTISLLTGNSGGVVNLGANTLFVNQAVNSTFSGTIQGSGNFTKQNSGALILDGVSSFFGLTRVSGGTLALAGNGSIEFSKLILESGTTFDISATNGGATVRSLDGDIGSIVNLGSKYLTCFLDTVVSSTFSGAIQGTGGLGVRAVGGALILDQINSYTGGTSIVDGTLKLIGSGSIDTSSGLDTGVGTFDISGASGPRIVGDLQGGPFSQILLGGNSLSVGALNSTIFSGTIQGSGSVTKVGSGSLTLDGSNTYTGGTIVTAGTLIGSSFSFPAGGNINNNAAVIFNQTSDGTFSGQLSGTGNFSKQGAALLSLTGINTQGNTDVIAGILAVNGTLTSLGGFTVAPGGTLKGVGVITANPFIQGTLAPGNSIGTLNVIGNVTFASGSHYLVEVSPAQNSLLNVTGDVTIQNGSSLGVTFDPGAYPANANYTIIQTTAGVSGTFSSVASMNAPSVNISVQYLPVGSPDHVDIVFTFSTLAKRSPPGNPKHVAVALDDDNPPNGSDLRNVMNQLQMAPNSQVLGYALNQMHSALYNAQTLTSQNDMLYIGHAISNRLEQLYLSPCLKNDKTDYKWNLWGDIYGDWYKQSGANQIPGFHAKTGGVILGSDRTLSEHVNVGISGAYSYSSINWKRPGTHGHISTGYGSLYSSFFWDHFFLDIALSGAYNWYEAQRKIEFFETNRTAKGHHHGYEIGGHLRPGWIFHTKMMDIMPFVSGDYVFVHQSGYTEKGANSLDLEIKSKRANLYRGELGIQFARCFTRPLTKWIPLVKLGVIEEWRPNGAHTSERFKDTPAWFTVKGYNPERSIISPAASLTAVFFKDKLNLSLRYEGEFEFGGNYRDQRGDLLIIYGF